VNGISQGGGADLLVIYSQSAGQGMAELTGEASAAALKIAVAEAKMSEAFLVGSDGNSTGNQLDVYA
jgi:hypothetical protein